MTILIMVFCAVAASADICETVRVPIDQPVQCQTGITAQAYAPQWLREHPGYAPARWHCVDEDEL